MELQSASSGLPGPLAPGPLSPGPLSPTSDYGGPLSPSSGLPGPSRGSSPGFSGQAAFNYNQLEGRFKQLQGKTAPGSGSDTVSSNEFMVPLNN